MATVKYRGLSGTRVELTVNTTDTLTTITNAAIADEGLNANYYADFFLLRDNSVLLSNSGAQTYAQLNLTADDELVAVLDDDPATYTKQERQVRKLEIASIQREDDGYANHVYDLTSLPDTYNGNVPGADDNPNTGGLLPKRPWIEVGAIAAPTSIAEAVDGGSLPDLQVWYDGSDPTTIQNAGVDEEDIEQWNDKSNFAHNANPVGGASAKPLYEASDLKNNNEYVKFDGNDILSVNPFAQLDEATGWSMFIVANATDISANGGLCATNTGDLKIRIDADGSTSFRSTSNNYAYFGTGTITDNTWHIWSLIYDGTASGNARLIGRLDKTSATLYTGTQPAQLSTGSDIMYLGSTNEAGYDLTGYIGEVIMFNRTLTATEYANVENYLATKWGL